MTLASCAKDVRFYQWPNISHFAIYETPEKCVNIKGISWSSSGEQLVAVKSKGCPVILNIPAKTKNLVEAFEWSNIKYASVATFSNRNPDLVTFGTEDCIFTYNIRHTRRYQKYIKVESPVQNIEFSSDDQCFAVGCACGQIFLFNSNYKPCACFFVSESPTLSTIAYSKMIPHLLAGASKDGMLSLWNSDTADNIFSSRSHTGRVTDMTFFESNNLSSVGVDGKFISHDLRSGNTSCCCDLKCALSSLAYLNGTNELAISTMNGQLRSYDSRNMEVPLKTLVALPNSSIKKIAFPCFQYLGNSQMYSDNCSASGDFSLPSGSSPNRSNLTPLDLAAGGKNTNSTNYEEFTKIVEKKVKITTKIFEDKLLKSFCNLRIDTGKQFSSLEAKTKKNWNTFVDFLRVSGQESYCTSSAGVSGQKNKYKMDFSEQESNCTSSAGVSGHNNKNKTDVSEQESNCISSAGVSSQKAKKKMERNSNHTYLVNKSHKEFND